MTRNLDQQTVLKLALISEAAIAGLALAWSWLRETEIFWGGGFEAVAIGAAAVPPLFLFNYLLFGLSTVDCEPWRQLERFRSEVILPLCRNISPIGAAVIGAASGFSEEYLFRGVINREAVGFLGVSFGILLGSLVFSYVHFIGSGREFWLLVLVYTAVGAYLSAIYLATGSIWAPVVTHGIYNFVAILYFRSWAIRMNVPE